MSTLDRTLEPKATPVRRVEVITGAGGRRRWSDDDKARIVEETLAPGAVVSAIARRHGLSPQQVFAWRRQARDRVPQAVADVPAFAPVVVGAVAPANWSSTAPTSSGSRTSPTSRSLWASSMSR